MEAPRATMLELQALTRRFGATTAVDGVDLTVPAGQMLGIIGRSGAGKSTLLRLVNRLVEPSAGRILAEGRDVTALARPGAAGLAAGLRHGLPAVQPGAAAGRADQCPGRPAGAPAWLRRALVLLAGAFSAEERAMALAALDRFGLAEVALQRAETLSGGQQQRVAHLPRPAAGAAADPGG